MTSPDLSASVSELAPTLARLHQAWQAQRPDYAQRQQDLRRLQQRLRERLDSMTAAIAEDFGHRSVAESRLADGMTVLHSIAHARRHLRDWMRPRAVATGWRLWPARAQVRPSPVGVVGIVSPWNYPVNLALTPLVAAIAAGNHVYLKPSEHTPRTSEFLQQLLADTFPAERVAVTLGGPEIGAAFSALPFDHLFFTGSTAVGRQVMAAAAAHLTPVTLELGGKSPAVICADFSLDRAAARIATGKWFNAGQTCIAPDYVLIDAPRRDAFVAAMRAQADARYAGSITDSTDYTRIINDRQFTRLQGLVDDARRRGLEVIELGRGDPATRTFAPTLILDPDDDAAVMREEIFGPILPIIAVDSLEQAIARIAQHPRPLALYPFSGDHEWIERLLQAIPAGGVTVNDTLLHFMAEDLPFGGIGPSGMGAYHGRFGFDTFSKALPVLRQSARAPSDLLKPPYQRLGGLIRWMSGR